MVSASAAALAAVTIIGLAVNPLIGHATGQVKEEIGFIDLGSDLRLRRMVVHSENTGEVILLLHGFPETLLVWRQISRALAGRAEVHSFDWPGYGQSSRPSPETFSYSPKDYAKVLNQYIDASGIDRSKLTIYATDIGALPALLLAIEQPDCAKEILVSDFAPFNRPQYMYEVLQNLKTEPSASKTRAYMNQTSEEILTNAYRRGLPKEEQFDLPREVEEDMRDGWYHGDLTSADAFYHYYQNFNRDEDYLEANLAKLRTPVRAMWGERDFYIKQEMGEEFARRTGSKLKVVPGAGHYLHLQHPELVIQELRY